VTKTIERIGDAVMKAARRPPPLKKQISPAVLRELQQWIGRSAERAHVAEKMIADLVASK